MSRILGFYLISILKMVACWPKSLKDYFFRYDTDVDMITVCTALILKYFRQMLAPFPDLFKTFFIEMEVNLSKNLFL